MGLLKRADRSVLGGATTVEDGKHYEEASEDLASVQREKNRPSEGATK